MKKLLLSLLLLASTVIGQEQLFQIRDFKGLNTVAGDFAVQPNEARLAHNIDFGRNVGSITKRYGYDSISTISGMDSIVAIYGAYYSDGTQQLFVVADLADSGYGKVYVTPKGSSNLDSATAIWNYWSVLGYPTFTMADDAVYIVNGYNRGIVYKNSIARDYPPRAPGEPSVIPLSDSGGLDGTYRYIFTYTQGDTIGGEPYVNTGYVTQPVSVSNGRILLKDFQWVAGDSITPIPDTIYIYIYRSDGDVGYLDDLDSAHYIGNVIQAIGESSLNTLIYIDSISDDNLNSAALKIYDSERVGRDSLGAIDYRYGSPTFHKAVQVTTGSRIFSGITKQPDTLGVGYTCAFIDTVTSIESDTGRTMFIWCNPDSVLDSVVIGLPRISAGDSGLVINLYRTLIEQVTYDSSYYVLDTVLPATNDYGVVTRLRWIDYRAVDTIVSRNYYLVGQYSYTDSIAVDTIGYDSLSTRRLFNKSTPPSIMSQIMTYQGRLYGTKDSRLWRSGLLNSLVDTIQYWGQLDFQSLNESDGDIGTVAFPTRTAIRFMKNFSSFNIYDDFSKAEISNTIGCIAPRSYSAGTGGHYYLSKAGVIYETDGQQLERTFNTNLVSQKIKNFDSYDITELANAYGTYFNRKYMLTVGDTTYVFDERSGEWSTWSLPIASATKYGTESNVTFIPGDTLYFIKPGGSTIYRYGTSEYDNYRAGVDSTNIQWLWQSPPLFTDFREVAVNSIGMWCNSTTTGDSIGVLVIDEEGVTAGSAWYKNLSQRYFKNGVSTDKGKYFTLKLGTASDAVDIGSTYIDGLDIFYKIISNTQIE